MRSASWFTMAQPQSYRRRSSRSWFRPRFDLLEDRRLLIAYTFALIGNDDPTDPIGLSINDHGLVALEGADYGIYVSDGKMTRTIALPSGDVSRYRDPSINNNGMVAFRGIAFGPGQEPTGIYEGDGTAAARAIETVGTHFGFGRPRIDNAGDVAYFAARPFADDYQLHGIRFRDGDTGILGTLWEPDDLESYFFDLNLDLADGGFVLFASYKNEQVGDPPYLLHSLYKTDTGALSTVVDNRDGKYLRFEEWDLNNRGDVAFTAVVSTDEGLQQAIYWKSQTGTPQLLAQTNDEIAGVVGPAINDGATVVFYRSQFAGFKEGVYTGAAPQLDKVLETGDTLFGKTVVNVGSEPVINNCGQIAVRVTVVNAMDEEEFLIVRADPPGCGDNVVDVDRDGVDDRIEDGAANEGDGNNDGTRDRDQPNVASLPNAEDMRYVTLVSPAGTTLAGVKARKDLTPPNERVLPVGLFEFRIEGLTPGAATTLTLFLPAGVNPSSYVKYGPTVKDGEPTWYDFLHDGELGADLNGDVARLYFVDGQLGDDDLRMDGVIRDGGGPIYNGMGGTGQIRGIVWNDYDGDGVRDADEPPLPNWTMFLDQSPDRNGVFTGNEPTVTTRPDGAFAFTGLAAESHRIGHVRGPYAGQGYERTSPIPADVAFAFSGYGSQSAIDNRIERTFVADYDGDGLPDVATLESINNFEDFIPPLFVVRRNNPALPGTFKTPVIWNGGSSLVFATRAAGIADFNRDGLMDHVLGGVDDKKINWLDLGLSVATGGSIRKMTLLPTLAAPPPDPLERECVYDLQTGDFTGDGWADVYVQLTNEQPTWYLLANKADGSGEFLPAVLVPFLAGKHVQTGDFNGDGWLDVASIDLLRPEVYLNRADRSGLLRMAAEEPYGFVSPVDAVTADFDRDGWLDLVALHRLIPQQNPSELYYWRNLADGTGRFDSPQRIAHVSMTSLAAADFDLDGWIDLAVGKNVDPTLQETEEIRASREILLFANTPEGPKRFGTPQKHGNANIVNDVATGDFNLDELPDLVITRQNSVRVGIVGERVLLTEGQERVVNWGWRQVDADEDGIPAAVESQGPNNGDANDDGIRDQFQPHVTSLRNAVDGGYVTLEIYEANGAKLVGVRASVPDPEDVPPNVAFPFGLFKFDVTGLATGGDAVVLLYHPKLPGDFAGYWKYGPEPDNQVLHHYKFGYDDVTKTGALHGGQPVGPLGTYITGLYFVDGLRGDDLLVDGEIHDPGGLTVFVPPALQQVVVDNGTAQRSMVRSLTVHFSEAVTLDPGAFLVTRTGTTKPIAFTLTTTVTGGRTIATLTFTGSNLVGKSLKDGRYVLTTFGNRVHNGDGIAMARDGTNSFFRLYGDSDGDLDVDKVDHNLFKTTLGKKKKHAKFLAHLDYDKNNVVNAADEQQFLKRKGKRPQWA